MFVMLVAVHAFAEYTGLQYGPVILQLNLSALQQGMQVSFIHGAARWHPNIYSYVFLQMYRLASCNRAWSEKLEIKLMDDQQEKDCASGDQESILINGVKEDGKEI